MDELKEISHHKQQSLCTTRPLYRQGKNLTAVKVYTINSESQHLFVYGVPKINLRNNIKSLFSKYGQILSIHLVTGHKTEIFTECYHIQFQRIQSARIAKKLVDNRSFYGGILHVCYVPEYETIQETETKLQQRQKDILIRLKRNEIDVPSSSKGGSQVLQINHQKHIDNQQHVTPIYEDHDLVLSWHKQDRYDRKTVHYPSQVPNNITYVQPTKRYEVQYSNYKTPAKRLALSSFCPSSLRSTKRLYLEQKVMNNESDKIFGPLLPDISEKKLVTCVLPRTVQSQDISKRIVFRNKHQTSTIDNDGST